MVFIEEKNRIYVKNDNGETVAEVTFPDLSQTVVHIDHTFVDSSLRGQGMASRLLKAAAEKLRKENKRAVPSCSYADQWFRKNPEYSDVLYQGEGQYY